MPGVPPDAVDRLKGAIKGLFKKNRKPAKEEEKPTGTAAVGNNKPTETKPADPTAGTAPTTEVAKAGETAPAEPKPAEGATKEVEQPAAAPPASTTDSATATTPAAASSGVEATPASDTPAATTTNAMPPDTATATQETSTTPATAASSEPTKLVPEGMSATSGPLDDNPEILPEPTEGAKEEEKPAVTS
ncbi:hypothetical protein NA57DRAFT_76996 [Rhizodiscina lignyota]|uniref:Uncharacterized protein n=1 Tax=Rhizodiscina lignyota TaxID=1504668 RepID=A0A9P4M5L0_9PEZI|nr:hypothetical protein NA57DRAFT_76996 [Rhizodiscina lignyota]